MQKSFSDLEYATNKKLTRRDRFLAEIDSVMPCGRLHKLIEPFYPTVESAGRPPIGLARMLRMYVA
jgi:IS5 family transposase